MEKNEVAWKDKKYYETVKKIGTQSNVSFPPTSDAPHPLDHCFFLHRDNSCLKRPTLKTKQMLVTRKYIVIVIKL